ncbi:FUSC family protein [Anaerococcus lactolyticus]|uniref:Membrane protein n=1 Tax=Anaerococcus lactolyticus S7-1-13 TaxID=1284686 RepID=A0A095X1N0_9FIRM|nr:FUSC family protein [Anaerococcus lactolyticus]KGF03641.1 membrane protein [Anaerococcus lactolyticus S7-1-13]
MQVKFPGPRIRKTGLAVLISMIISHYRPGEGLAFYSAIAAIICMQQNVHQTFHKGLGRIIGTLFGGTIGLIYLLTFPSKKIPDIVGLFVIAILVTIIIWVMSMINKKDAVSIAGIVFLSVTINHAGDLVPFNFALNRVIDTLIGVIVAFLVNYIDFRLKESLKF